MTREELIKLLRSHLTTATDDLGNPIHVIEVELYDVADEIISSSPPSAEGAEHKHDEYIACKDCKTIITIDDSIFFWDTGARRCAKCANRYNTMKRQPTAEGAVPDDPREQNKRMREWFKERTGLEDTLLSGHMEQIDVMLKDVYNKPQPTAEGTVAKTETDTGHLIDMPDLPPPAEGAEAGHDICVKCIFKVNYDRFDKARVAYEKMTTKIQPSAEGAEEILKKIFAEIWEISPPPDVFENPDAKMSFADAKFIAERFAALTVDKMYPKEFCEWVIMGQHGFGRIAELGQLRFINFHEGSEKKYILDELFNYWKENQR